MIICDLCKEEIIDEIKVVRIKAENGDSLDIKKLCINCYHFLNFTADDIKKQNKTAKGMITLCGSTRFYETFLEVNNKLTAKGYIVLSIGVVKSKAVMLDKSDTELEKRLDALHREKISMSDSIFVIDVDGYIGESTKGEIEFAEKHGKRTYKLSNGDLEKL